MKHPKHPAAAAAAVDEDLISLLMNDLLLLYERLLRQTTLNPRVMMQKNGEDLLWDVPVIWYADQQERKQDDIKGEIFILDHVTM